MLTVIAIGDCNMDRMQQSIEDSRNQKLQAEVAEMYQRLLQGIRDNRDKPIKPGLNQVKELDFDKLAALINMTVQGIRDAQSIPDVEDSDLLVQVCTGELRRRTIEQITGNRWSFE